VSPSAALWLAAHRRPRRAGPVAVAAGPGLAGADAEADAVAALYGVQALAGATTAQVRTAMDGAALVHLATHGTIRADNPLFSALHFHDGPLMVYDLPSVAQAPDTVVLAACEAGRSIAAVGDELLGVSATFLAQGSRALVASVLPILDAETTPLMLSFHQALTEGDSVSAALVRAQQELVQTGPAGVATAAGFLCFGDGFAAPAVS
jgi:CHAT domain-containing protein